MLLKGRTQCCVVLRHRRSRAQASSAPRNRTRRSPRGGPWNRNFRVARDVGTMAWAEPYGAILVPTRRCPGLGAAGRTALVLVLAGVGLPGRAGGQEGGQAGRSTAATVTWEVADSDGAVRVESH